MKVTPEWLSSLQDWQAELIIISYHDDYDNIEMETLFDWSRGREEDGDNYLDLLHVLTEDFSDVHLGIIDELKFKILDISSIFT